MYTRTAHSNYRILIYYTISPFTRIYVYVTVRLCVSVCVFVCACV